MPPSTPARANTPNPRPVPSLAATSEQQVALIESFLNNQQDQLALEKQRLDLQHKELDPGDKYAHAALSA